MTPGEFADMVEAWKARERRRAQGVAILSAMFGNANRGKGQAAFRTEEFLPFQSDE